MEQTEKEHQFESADLTITSVGLVLRMPIEEVPTLKAFLKTLPNSKIVYQRITSGYLTLKETSDKPDFEKK